MLTIWFIGMYVIFILQQIMIWIQNKKIEKQYIILQEISRFIIERKNTQKFRKECWNEKQVNIDIVLEQYDDLLEYVITGKAIKGRGGKK